MVKLYIWQPSTTELVMHKGLAPDVGHSALEVVNANGAVTCYASFWPERDSLIGRITQFWKPRETRNPLSYEDESDPDGGFMQRPAEYIGELIGLDEPKIARLWNELAGSDYDFLSWNCSNVCKFLLLSAVPPEKRAALEDAMGVCPDETNCICDESPTLEKLRFLATSPFIDCRPEDLKRAADTCLIVL